MKVLGADVNKENIFYKNRNIIFIFETPRDKIIELIKNQIKDLIQLKKEEYEDMDEDNDSFEDYSFRYDESPNCLKNTLPEYTYESIILLASDGYENIDEWRSFSDWEEILEAMEELLANVEAHAKGKSGSYVQR